MRIFEELITDDIINTYKEELFLFTETKEELKDKRIVKILNDNNEIISIAMYSHLNTEEIELYLNENQKQSIRDVIIQGIYLDAITSLKHGYNACKDIVNYLLEKSKVIWCYSHVQAIEFWKNKMQWIDTGENVFVNQLS